MPALASTARLPLLMKKKLLIFAVTLVVLLVAVVVIARQVLIGYLTPDFLVTQIEQRWNCRAAIEEVNVKLLGTATVELKGLALAPRDQFADNATPLSERPALEDTIAELGASSVYLEILPGELIRRQLNIRHLKVDGLAVTTTVNRDGDASIESLFEEPKGGSSSEPPLPIESGDPPSLGASATEEQGQSLKLATVADRMEITEGDLHFQIESSGAAIQLKAFSLALTNIDIDPDALEAHNRAEFEFGGDLVVDAPEGNVPEGADPNYLDAHITGNGKIQPFDPETGEVNPVWSVNLTMHEGAEINTFPVVARLKQLLKDVDTAGVELDDITLRGTLLADATTEIGHAEGKYLVKEPLELPLPDTTIQIQRGSWFHTGTNEHKAQALLVASEPLTRQIESKVDVYLQAKAGSLASPGLRSLILSPVMRDGKLAIEVSSKGDLSKPKVDLVTPLGNLSDVLGTSKDTIDSLEKTGKALLKNLFGQ